MPNLCEYQRADVADGVQEGHVGATNAGVRDLRVERDKATKYHSDADFVQHSHGDEQRQ